MSCSWVGTACFLERRKGSTRGRHVLRTVCASRKKSRLPNSQLNRRSRHGIKGCRPPWEGWGISWPYAVASRMMETSRGCSQIWQINADIMKGGDGGYHIPTSSPSDGIAIKSNAFSTHPAEHGPPHFNSSHSTISRLRQRGDSHSTSRFLDKSQGGQNSRSVTIYSSMCVLPGCKRHNLHDLAQVS